MIVYERSRNSRRIVIDVESLVNPDVAERVGARLCYNLEGWLRTQGCPAQPATNPPTPITSLSDDGMIRVAVALPIGGITIDVIDSLVQGVQAAFRAMVPGEIDAIAAELEVGGNAD